MEVCIEVGEGLSGIASEQVSNFLGRFQRQPLTQLFCSGKWKK